MRYKSIIFAGFLLMTFVISACGTAVSSQGEGSSQRTLTVNGTGQAFMTPDIAYISIGVHTEDADAAKAVARNNTNSQKVAEALEVFGIDPEDIRTTNFSIYPQQQSDQNGELTGLIYVVDNNVFVTLRDLEQIGDVFNAVVEAGANNINSVQFDVEDKSEALFEARQEAVEDAQIQAKELAEFSGVSLGPVQNISTSIGGVPFPVIGGKGGGAMMSEASIPISPGQTIIAVNVNMIYEIQ